MVATPSIGLDLGSSSIKLVAVEESGGVPRVLRHLIQELPTADGAQPVDRAGWLQAALKEMNATAVTLAIGGPDVIIRRLKVPLMSRQELSEAVKWQLKDEVPFAVQEAVIAVAVVGEVWDKDIKKLDVLAAAAPRERVLQEIALVEQAGARVRRVIPTAAAMAAVLQRVSADHTRHAVAVVEMGAAHTHVVVLKDGLPRLTRELPIGSGHLTQALVGVAVSSSTGHTLDAAKAEAVKRQYGVMAEGAPGTTEEGISLEQLSGLMRSVLNPLVTELARLLDFYRAHVDEAGVDYLLVCGGGALLKQLPAYLSDGLGLRVDAYHPAFHEEAPRLVLALGAAVAAEGTVDVMPRERRRALPDVLAQRISAVAPKLLAGVGVALGCLLGISALFTTTRLQALRQEWRQVEPAHQQAVAMAAQQQRLQDLLATVRAFQDRQPSWDGLFKELGRMMPAAVELTELTVTPPESPTTPQGLEMHLKGLVTGSGSEGSLATFLEALEDSMLFRSPRLAGSQTSMGAAAVTTFEIVCELE